MVNTFADYKIMINRKASNICFISSWEPFNINRLNLYKLFCGINCFTISLCGVVSQFDDGAKEGVLRI